MATSLIQKYNVPGPRYTSYPTVPYWDAQFKVLTWETSIRQSYIESRETGISLYIHLPFCESLCTFCGCTKRITKNHSVEDPYISAVLNEWKLYSELLNEKPRIKEIHLGGGTPTFFSSQNLEKLINGIFEIAEKAHDCEMSFEGHPNNTTYEHLQKLYDLGFRRVSFGVQDYSEKVQIAIHRIQPFENVERVTSAAREIGYTSISHDLVFGLPFQKTEDILDTITKTGQLKPSRIAFYSYAHVPWIKGNGQRGFKDEDLPKDEEKRALYELGKKMLEQLGYHEIGMDHFALESDSLYEAEQQKKLHRNFMGYSSSKTQLMIGLGVSAIGDSWYGFAQNVKNIEEYYQLLQQNKLPLLKGHNLNAEDLAMRTHILNLMCQLETTWPADDEYSGEIGQIVSDLSELENDGLLQITENKIVITDAGKPFLRNICMAFDLRMKRAAPATKLFSMTV